uniref:DUF1834 family protein n=1 Tax=Desulfobacca acetoxidans TaxID=60893 RepID=A0A7C5END9_9BACT
MTGVSWIEVEDAMVEALKNRLGPTVKTVASYQGNWRQALREETWRLPAVLVMLTASRAEQIAQASFDVILEAKVLVLVRHFRGEAAGRWETGGAYDLLAGVRETLWHQDLGLDLCPFALVREEPLLNNGEFSVYQAYYRTAAVRDR